MVTSGLKKRVYMYIDAEGKESLELKGMPARERERRREWQWKVWRRRGGRTHKNQENGVWDFSGMKREVKTLSPLQDHKRLFLPLLSLFLPPLKLRLHRQTAPSSYLWNKNLALQRRMQVSSTCVGGGSKRIPIYNRICQLVLQLMREERQRPRCCRWCSQTSRSKQQLFQLRQETFADFLLLL